MQKVVVIVNSGDNVIPRHLLDELIVAAGADTWECIDLPTESRLTQLAADVCPRCHGSGQVVNRYLVICPACHGTGKRG